MLVRPNDALELAIKFYKEKYDEVRPALFYEMLLPIVLKANEALIAEREQVLKLRKEFNETGDLTPESMDELKKWIENHQELKDAVELKEGE